VSYVAQAIDKNTGFFVTCTHCESKEMAVRTAKYYRSIGYNAKVFTEDKYEQANKENYNKLREQIKLQKERMC